MSRKPVSPGTSIPGRGSSFDGRVAEGAISTHKRIPVDMVNRPGQLATLARELRAAGVNIETLAAFSTGPEAYVKLVVDNDESARIVLRNTGAPVEERRIVSATLHDQPGALAQARSVRNRHQFRGLGFEDCLFPGHGLPQTSFAGTPGFRLGPDAHDGG